MLACLQIDLEYDSAHFGGVLEMTPQTIMNDELCFVMFAVSRTSYKVEEGSRSPICKYQKARFQGSQFREPDSRKPTSENKVYRILFEMIANI